MINIEEIKGLINNFTDGSVVLTINKDGLEEEAFRVEYINQINKINPEKYGVYIWTTDSNGSEMKEEKIVYIGMAGITRNNGNCEGQSISGRLTNTRNGVSTNQYIWNFLEENNLNTMNIYIFYSKPDEPASYIEALLL